MSTNPSGRARTALFEWLAVGVLVAGCAVVTAGVMSFVADDAVAWLLIGSGAFVALVGAVVWTVIVKRRDPPPRAARQKL